MVRLESIQEPDRFRTWDLHDCQRRTHRGIFRVCSGNAFRMADDVDKIRPISFWRGMLFHVQKNKENGLEHVNLRSRRESQLGKDAFRREDEIRKVFWRASDRTILPNKELKVPTWNIHHIHLPVPDNNLVGMSGKVSHRTIVTSDGHQLPVHSLHSGTEALHQLHQHCDDSTYGIAYAASRKLYGLLLHERRIASVNCKNWTL